MSVSVSVSVPVSVSVSRSVNPYPRSPLSSQGGAVEDAALLGARHQAFDAQAEGDVHMEMAEEDEGCEDLVHLERVVPQGLSPYLNPKP